MTRFPHGEMHVHREGRVLTLKDMALQCQVASTFNRQSTIYTTRTKRRPLGRDGSIYQQAGDNVEVFNDINAAKRWLMKNIQLAQSNLQKNAVKEKTMLSAILTYVFFSAGLLAALRCLNLYKK